MQSHVGLCRNSITEIAYCFWYFFAATRVGRTLATSRRAHYVFAWMQQLTDKKRKKLTDPLLCVYRWSKNNNESHSLMEAFFAEAPSSKQSHCCDFTLLGATSWTCSSSSFGIEAVRFKASRSRVLQRSLFVPAGNNTYLFFSVSCFFLFFNLNDAVVILPFLTSPTWSILCGHCRWSGFM